MQESHLYTYNYCGKDYLIAEIPDVFTHQDGKFILIGPQSLNKVLYNDEDGYTDKKALRVDEQIYAFVDDTFFKLPLDQFIDRIKRLLD